MRACVRKHHVMHVLLVCGLARACVFSRLQFSPPACRLAGLPTRSLSSMRSTSSFSDMVSALAFTTRNLLRCGATSLPLASASRPAGNGSTPTSLTYAPLAAVPGAKSGLGGRPSSSSSLQPRPSRCPPPSPAPHRRQGTSRGSAGTPPRCHTRKTRPRGRAWPRCKG